MSFILEGTEKCAVIGSGSWATAIVKILLDNEKEVIWYVRRPDSLRHIAEYGNNPKYLRDVHFDTSRIHLTSDVDEAVSGASIVILATPSAFLESVLDGLTVPLSGKFVVSAVKGIIPDGLLTIAEFVNRRYGVPFNRIGIVTGPCHAEEVALERLSYLTVVCKSLENARTLARKFETRFIRTSTSTDIYGTEYAAALKNIYAIGVGIATGLGYGDNFLAVLISNSAMEMDRFLRESYPAERETTASAYLGDLLVTAYSQFSRNRTFGIMVGKGYSVRTAQIEMSMVAEGYYAAECIMRVNEGHGINIPIAEAVYAILYRGECPAAAIGKLTENLI